MKHVISILVNNHPGVMSHVSGLFTRRGYNIDSIAVGVTDNPEISCMTIVVNGDEAVVGQVKNQLLKLTDVLKVVDLAYHESLTRELVLMTIKSTNSTRFEIISICEVFQAKIVDMTDESLMVEFAGSSRQVNAIILMLKKFGISEIARTGQIALPYQTKEW
ncbi:MAG: acetolactate synthase small subunit [Leptospiraceae bacterium]|nr:acetolactate synthase small subunit [Leptospiraceae bacterium]MCK6380239.1 acetolactate synthase small subunit [Leptospiraceae bacterium]NUM41333.1 acetolactate synthase small subunit [Leptospiraceae bacterium]